MVSILFLTECMRNRIEKNVFTDLSLNLLFDCKILDTMSFICNADEIIARQDLFRALENKAFRNSLENLQSILLTLSQKESAMRNAKSKCEEYFQYRLLAEEYINLLEFLSNIIVQPDCRFMIGLISYAKQKSTIQAKLQEVLNEYIDTINAISRFTTSVATRITQVFPPNTPNTGLSVNNEIIDCARTLGLSILDLPRGFAKLRLTEDFSESVMHIFSNEFKKLAILKQQSESWIDLEIIRLKDELDFYFSIFDFTFKVAREKKIDYSYPKVAAVPRYFAKKVYDVTLIAKGVNTIIPNDISFDQDENVFFLMGANGGGKTTYLRACAVNLILFLSGCPVFCESCAACSAEIYPFRAVFTHFPTSEGYETTGRLEEEASRVNAITQHTNEVIFIFFNESFSGANETLGEKLTFETAAKIKRSKAFALFVTHFSKYGFGSFPILNAVIDEKEGNKRTFRIQRSSSREASHANDILRKYGLDSLSLEQKRISNNS